MVPPLHVWNIEASGIFQVGVAMCTVLLNATKVCSKALPCCGLARKADQRLVLCVPVLYNVQLLD